jgi:hypothetical protein
VGRRDLVGAGIERQAPGSSGMWWTLRRVAAGRVADVVVSLDRYGRLPTQAIPSAGPEIA